jgi:hypothetical protein
MQSNCRQLFRLVVHIVSSCVKLASKQQLRTKIMYYVYSDMPRGMTRQLKRRSSRTSDLQRTNFQGLSMFKTIFKRIAMKISATVLMLSCFTSCVSGEERAVRKKATNQLIIHAGELKVQFSDDERCHISLGVPSASAFNSSLYFYYAFEGIQRLEAVIGRFSSGTLTDLDGDGTIDISSDPRPDHESPVCLVWLPHRLIRTTGGRGCGGNQRSLEPNEGGYGGIHYQFFDHQWYWTPPFSELNEEFKPPTDVERKPVKYRTEFAGRHVFPTAKPIEMSHPEFDKSSDMWKIDTSFWADRKSPVTWYDDQLKRHCLNITGTISGPIEISTSNDLTHLQIIFNGQASFESWDNAFTNTSSETVQNVRPRRRIRLMNNVYHDINGDGALDGYHAYGETDAVIRVGLNLIPVAACDWEQGTAESKDKPTKRFSFESGRWSEVIKEDRD